MVRVYIPAVDQVGTLDAGAIVGGRFKLDRLIGRGGMGEVYAAHHVTTSKEVALKIIYSAQGATKDQTRRFMREARAATAIQHPNVIEVFDVFEDSNGTAVMVMELLKGEPLSHLMKRRGALELHEVATLLGPAMRALQAAHDKGVVHRDLKPDNIFLANTPSGVVPKLLDFGIAKVLDPARLGSETHGQATNTGSLLGTPHYMSIEQAMSEKAIDARTDVWSMGVIVFEALTGKRPLTYETLGEMYKAFLQDEVPSITRFMPDVPSDVAAALDQCLVKQPAERSKSVEALVAVLDRYTDPDIKGARVGGKVVAAAAVSSELIVETKSPVSTSIHAEAPPRSRTTAWLIGGAVALVVGIGAAFGISKTQRVDTPTPEFAKAAPSMLVASSSALPAEMPPNTIASSSPSALIATSASAPKVKPLGSTRPPASVKPPESASPDADAAPSAARRGIPNKLPY